MLKHLKVREVRAIIAAAETLNAKHPSSPLGTRGSEVTFKRLAAYEAHAKSLKRKISALSHDARMELMSLMWVGRDFEEDFDDALKYAYKNSDAGDVDYIADKAPALPTYLRKGVSRIGLSAAA
jgi:hypothetical protein